MKSTALQTKYNMRGSNIGTSVIKHHHKISLLKLFENTNKDILVTDSFFNLNFEN